MVEMQKIFVYVIRIYQQLVHITAVAKFFLSKK